MELKKIGVIHSPYKRKKEAPRQGSLESQESTIEVFPQYMKGLDRLEDLSNIIVLYWGSRADRSVLETIPPWGSESYGVFSLRAPNRPNPIALCVCEIISVEKNRIKVTGLDALNDSPLLDIKAYSAKLDCYPEAKSHPEIKEEKFEEEEDEKVK